MAWIGLRDKKRTLFDTRGLGPDRGNTEFDHNYGLTRGTLVVETEASASSRPVPILRFNGGRGLGLHLHILPGGGLVFVLTQGSSVQHCQFDTAEYGRTNRLLLSFSWDLDAGTGRFIVEQEERDGLLSAAITPVEPLNIVDLGTMFSETAQVVVSDDVVFAALSDRPEPIGPMPTLAGLVPLRTPDGYKPVGRLKRGDLVSTIDGHSVPILHAVSRTVPAVGRFEPVRIRAPFFGLKSDLVVGSDQRLLIQGSEVEYLFGQEAVLVPARHLAAAPVGHPMNMPDLVTYSQVLLPDHEVIDAAGTALESMFIGRIRRKPAVLNISLLAQFDRATLPDHARKVYPVLSAFDAKVLAEHRAA